ncbi:MAG: DUF4422 domain-containing protein [Clostridia bacterium]|nr:DUF4422 domain-containing protein [Clostridia bacterium]
MADGKTVKIIVAAHKAFRMPQDEMYLPLHVGAEGKKDQNGQPLDIGFVRDNTGDNISLKNPGYCELTGLYWAWKNLDADYIGLAHYRRHFSLHRKRDPFDGVLKYSELEPLLRNKRVIIPTKRRYYIESLYNHYKHTHYISQLDETRRIIEEKYPDYLPSFDRVVRRTWGHMFNMMIMERGLVDDYCRWLFDILFELEKRMKAGMVEMPALSSFQARFYGRISEIIFNVWLDYQLRTGRISRKDMYEIPCRFMEKVDWFKKIRGFLKAKYFGIRYVDSV